MLMLFHQMKNWLWRIIEIFCIYPRQKYQKILMVDLDQESECLKFLL